MRIVYVLTSLGIGGAERQVVALAGRMAARGHTVALLVLMPRLPEEWPTAVQVIHLNMRKTPASLFRALLQGRRFLGEFRPDLVHSHGFHGNLVARLLRLLRPTPALICTLHNEGERSWLRMFAYFLTDGLSSRTTAVCEEAARHYMRWMAVPRRKCIVVTNGIDIGEFAPIAERRVQMRRQLGAGDEFLWLAVGRVVPAKDYPNLLHAFAQVRAARYEAQLWVAGDKAGAEFERASALAVELGLAGSVRWLGLRRDMPALLGAADAFVLSSAWEGMPLAVGEAMAMEKPVVATDVGGVRHLVGAAGTIVPARNSAALAQAMLALMRKPLEERRLLGRTARQRIVQGFSMEKRADDWENLYRAVLARTP